MATHRPESPSLSSEVPATGEATPLTEGERAIPPASEIDLAGASITKPLRFDSLTQGAYLQMWRTYDRMKAIEEELFSQFDISAQQYNTLRLLQYVHPNGMATLQIAERLISRAPDITRLIDRLEERGLVQRSRKTENRRVVEVALTAEGQKLLDELKGPVQKCHEQQLGHLTAGQLHELIQLLKLAGEPHEDPGSRWTATSSRP